MKKLSLRLVILIGILVLLDLIFGIIFRQIIEHSPDGRYYKANYSLTQCNEELVVFGSSRAETNFVPSVFTDSLNLSAWNTGRGGQTLPFWYAMQQGVLNINTPKVAVVNIENDFLTYDMSNGYERAGFLRPFYRKHYEIRPIINRISSFEKTLMSSNIYAFNSSFYYLLRPYLIRGLDGKKEFKGWKTRYGTIEQNNKDYYVYNSTQELNMETTLLFNKFIENFTNKGCNVFIVVSPNYKQLVKYSPTLEYVSNMNNVTLLNHSNNKKFVDNHLYFNDNFHLNIEGAIEFSKCIGNEIARTYNMGYSQ